MKSRRKVTIAYLDKLIASGHGQGVLADYRPWLKIRSFASQGTSRIVPGAKIPRGHHVFSEAEYHCLVLLEFRADVIDIREQFPLVDYWETYKIAVGKNIRPAYYPGTKVPHVYSTDFMLTTEKSDGTTLPIAISLKYRQELVEASPKKRLRIIEKLEVEQEYWALRGVSWNAVFAEDLPKIKIRNLIMLRGYARISSSIAVDKNFRKVREFLGEVMTASLTLSQLLHKMSNYLYIPYHETKDLFFYMVWHRKIDIDLDNSVIYMTQPIGFRLIDPVSEILPLRGTAR